jgi:hypothetical protein
MAMLQDTLLFRTISDDARIDWGCGWLTNNVAHPQSFLYNVEVFIVYGYSRLARYRSLLAYA